jgi:hypothetical protein
MPPVVTASSKVLCGPLTATAHGGTVATVGSPKLTVAGSPVLLASGIVGAMNVTGCTTPAVTGPPPSKPCTSVLAVTPSPSLATKLFVSGNPVVLASLKGSTDGVIAGTPQMLLTAIVTQTLLTAI